MDCYKSVTTSLNKKVHVCDVCRKCFGCKSQLKTHMLVHTGTKDFQCHVCLKKFAQKQNLTRHMIIRDTFKIHPQSKSTRNQNPPGRTREPLTGRG